MSAECGELVQQLHDLGVAAPFTLLLGVDKALAEVAGKVTFMGSSGINTLLSAHQVLGQADGWLRLAGTRDCVMRPFQFVGLDTVIDCYTTLSGALNA
ncbi:STAS domain-containing protein [Streptomyces sp. NPDC056817]|uniref:STAS domain-containing protein n=1 Tax=Streptomyces sp. NPDC056817 TaxID=3345950 RepID=UPI0036C542E5